MATDKPDFFSMIDGGLGTSYLATMGIHLQKVFRHKLDSTFINSEGMSEIARVRYRLESGGVRTSLD